MNQKNEPTKNFCCQINNILQEIYYEQIMGKKGYALGYYTTYYHLLKELKKVNQLCEQCQDYANKAWEIYWQARQKTNY